MTISHSNHSAEFIIRYMVIWSTFIGLACAERRDFHVRFNLIETLIPATARLWLKTLVYLTCIGLCLIVAWTGYEMVLETRMLGESLQTALRLPLWIPKMAVALGGILLALQYVASLHRLWTEQETRPDVLY